MITLELCIKNIQGGITTVDSTIKVELKESGNIEIDRYYKVTNISNENIELDNAFTIELNNIIDFKLLS